MSIDFETLEHKELHIKLLQRKYLPDWVATPHRNDIPHLDAYVSSTIQSYTTETYSSLMPIEFKHEYHPSNNLCLEYIANIPLGEEYQTLGIPRKWNTDNDTKYAALLDRAKQRFEQFEQFYAKKSGPSYGLMTTPLRVNHVTQYIRAWPNADNTALLKANLYYFDTARLQKYVQHRRDYWSFTFDDKNDNHSCFSALVPVDSLGLEDTMLCPPENITMLYQPYDLFIRAKRDAEERRKEAEKQKAKKQLENIIGD